MVGASTGVFAATSSFEGFPLLLSREREAVARTGGHQGFLPSADSFAMASPVVRTCPQQGSMPAMGGYLRHPPDMYVEVASLDL